MQTTAQNSNSQAEDTKPKLPGSSEGGWSILFTNVPEKIRQVQIQQDRKISYLYKTSNQSKDQEIEEGYDSQEQDSDYISDSELKTRQKSARGSVEYTITSALKKQEQNNNNEENFTDLIQVLSNNNKISMHMWKYLQKVSSPQQVVDVIQLIEKGETQKAEEVALNEEFIQKNKQSIAEGQILTSAIQKNCIDLALKLYKTGYYRIPSSYYFGSGFNLSSIIENGFYEKEHAALLL